MKVPNKFQIDYVDCSSLDSFARCPFKYMLSRKMGLTKKDRPHIALDYGTIMHECLPLVYDHPIQDVKNLFDKLWATKNYGEEDKKRNTPCAHLLLENFATARTGSNIPYKALKLDIPKLEIEDQLTEGEIPFLIDTGGAYPFAGRIDLPVELTMDGSLWALDYKTTGEMSPRFFDGFENHPQALGYTLALSHLTGKKVNGFIVDAIRVCPTPKRPSIVPHNQWHPVHVSDTKLEWMVEWINRLSLEIQICNETQRWPRNPSACSPYAMFGMPGYSCPYKDICACTQDTWLDMTKYYDVEIWHPFELKQEKEEKGKE